MPKAALQHVIATNPCLSDTILAAFLARRCVLLSGASAAIRVVGSRFSLESLRVRLACHAQGGSGNSLQPFFGDWLPAIAADPIRAILDACQCLLYFG